ncbi:hypothetical protein [Algoriphagus vanfongensis]|uniref:hypothetical protein n=1 Tax=Algoriphagus vanfongensis TaxID=426371 RepID=UPI000402025F|nr:hypothetical protein [Algoriphagus vanfongensis]
MKSRLNQLLDKYWEAESSLEEEKELRGLLSQTEGFEAEKKLFGVIDAYASEETQMKMPRRSAKVRKFAWLNWAASVAILIGTFVGWRAYERHQQEQAYQEVVAALSLIQENWSKGQQEMDKMSDFKYLSTPGDLFEKKEK